MGCFWGQEWVSFEFRFRRAAGKHVEPCLFVVNALSVLSIFVPACFIIFDCVLHASAPDRGSTRFYSRVNGERNLVAAYVHHVLTTKAPLCWAQKLDNGE